MINNKLVLPNNTIINGNLNTQTITLDGLIVDEFINGPALKGNREFDREVVKIDGYTVIISLSNNVKNNVNVKDGHSRTFIYISRVDGVSIDLSNLDESDTIKNVKKLSNLSACFDITDETQFYLSVDGALGAWISTISKPLNTRSFLSSGYTTKLINSSIYKIEGTDSTSYNEVQNKSINTPKSLIIANIDSDNELANKVLDQYQLSIFPYVINGSSAYCSQYNFYGSSIIKQYSTSTDTIKNIFTPGDCSGPNIFFMAKHYIMATDGRTLYVNRWADMSGSFETKTIPSPINTAYEKILTVGWYYSYFITVSSYGGSEAKIYRTQDMINFDLVYTFSDDSIKSVSVLDSFIYELGEFFYIPFKDVSSGASKLFRFKRDFTTKEKMEIDEAHTILNITYYDKGNELYVLAANRSVSPNTGLVYYIKSDNTFAQVSNEHINASTLTTKVNDNYLLYNGSQWFLSTDGVNFDEEISGPQMGTTSSYIYSQPITSQITLCGIGQFGKLFYDGITKGVYFFINSDNGRWVYNAQPLNSAATNNLESREIKFDNVELQENANDEKTTEDISEYKNKLNALEQKMEEMQSKLKKYGIT